MQDLLGLRDSNRIKAAAGLAGGIGHEGAVCGIVTGGALALALAAGQTGEDQAAITARGCELVNRYVQRFSQTNGSVLCRDIARTDFTNDGAIRRYILTRSRVCIKAASRAAADMVGMIEATQQFPGERYSRLNDKFFQSDFHCAYAVVNRSSELLTLNQMIGPNILIPLNGGIGYSGGACAALLGGCIAIGLAAGGDTSETGMASSMKRIILTLISGASAFSRTDLSPANDALLRCSKLFRWFENKFGSSLCRELTKVNFDNPERANQYFQSGIEQCKLMAAQTAEKAAETAR